MKRESRRLLRMGVSISRFTRDVIGRSLLVIVLFIAAGVYVVFAIQAGAGLIWLVVELVQVGVFGTTGSLWIPEKCLAAARKVLICG